MGYALSMSGEIREWLASLDASDPDAAMVVGQALVALADAGPDLGPPVVVALDSRPVAEDLAEALDYSYQSRLERQQAVRRAVADVSDLGAEVRAQIIELDASHSIADAAELRRLLPGLDRAEQRLTAASQKMQADLDAFRVRKETMKAKHTAAVAEKTIAEYFAHAAARYGDEELARDTSTIAEAAERIKNVTAEMERELGRQASTRGLLELRPSPPGAPAEDIRIILAVEPPGTALLISVIEGGPADRSQHDAAVAASAEVLRQVRAGQDPEAAAVTFTGAQSFLDEFFPASADELRAGAADLIASARAWARATLRVGSLADQRIRPGLSQADVAGRMGVRQERVSAIAQTDALTALTIPGLPFSLAPEGYPQCQHRVEDGTLTLTSGPRTDMFVDPAGTGVVPDAGRLVGTPPGGDFSLVARVTVEFASTYDAGVLLLYAGERRWAKLCFELSPQRKPTAVTVVTKGTSDDCNSFEVTERSLWLRMTRTGAAWAFHASADGSWWRLLRYFSLNGLVRVGFLAQSPTGKGCTAVFERIGLRQGAPSDLRDGS